jgi:hypothetical protein
MPGSSLYYNRDALNTQRGIDEALLKKPYNDLMSVDNSDANGLAVTSTNIRIKAANGVTIGMIQSFSVSENKDVTKVQSIGIEGVTQAVPQNYKGGTIQATRVALYGSRFYDAFKMEEYMGEQYREYNVFKTLKDQRLPFEIRVDQSMTNGGENGKQYTETYIDCWISSYKKNYTTSNVTVSESVSIAYADCL